MTDKDQTPSSHPQPTPVQELTAALSALGGPSQTSPRQSPDNASSSSSVPEKPVMFQGVWAPNLDHEFKNLADVIKNYPFVTVDTEFPGDIYPRPHGQLSAEDAYRHMRDNVNATSLIQVGLTLTDAAGNLPDRGTDRRLVWEFNFDFDIDFEQNNPASIEMLLNADIDFELLRTQGIYSTPFAQWLTKSRVALNTGVVWIAFHSDHDFGYLVKALTKGPLPETLQAFLYLVRLFFGKAYDVKYLAEKAGYGGGLNGIAELLGLERAAGAEHQAGSDSLLTSDMFWHLKNNNFSDATGLHRMKGFAGIIYGLDQN